MSAQQLLLFIFVQECKPGFNFLNDSDSNSLLMGVNLLSINYVLYLVGKSEKDGKAVYFNLARIPALGASRTT